MAITTLAGAISGQRLIQPFQKTGITMSAVGGMRGYTPWYVGNRPVASSSPSPGVNGEAVTPVSGASVNGRIPRSNPGAGVDAYLSKLRASASQPGTLWLVDRLWQNSGLSSALTTLQSITPAALPARDLNASTNGEGVMAAIECTTTMGLSSGSLTLTYTDQDGNTGNTTSITPANSPPVGTWEIFNVAAGDTGIRAVTGYQATNSRSAGSFSIVLFKLIAQLEIPIAGESFEIDTLTSGRPEILDDAVLQLVFIPSATTALQLTGSYVESHG